MVINFKVRNEKKYEADRLAFVQEKNHIYACLENR